MAEHQPASEESGRSQSPLTFDSGIYQDKRRVEEHEIETATGIERLDAEKHRDGPVIYNQTLIKNEEWKNVDGVHGSGGFKWPDWMDMKEVVDTTEKLRNIERLDMTQELESAHDLDIGIQVQVTPEMERTERPQEAEVREGDEELKVVAEGWKAEEISRESNGERTVILLYDERKNSVTGSEIELKTLMQREPVDMDTTANKEKTSDIKKEEEIPGAANEVSKQEKYNTTDESESTVEEKTERCEQMGELETADGLESVIELERTAGAEQRDVLESTELTFPHGVFHRVRRDTMESQTSSIDLSDDALESDDSSDVGIHRQSTNSDPISAAVRRRLINRASQPRHGTSSSEDDTDQDGRELFPPVLQRSTTFERVLSDAIVHQAPIEELKVILDAGAKLMDPSARKPNPIHYTVWQRYPDAAELLLQQGYDVNALDDFGYSALHLASRHGYTDMMEILIKHESRINFNAVDTEDRFPIDAVEEPLRLAMKYGHHDSAKLLLENGANPNGRYFFGSEINLASPLQPELQELLLEFGAKVDAQDRNGLTPIMKACRLRRGMESLLLLLSYGGDVNIRADARHDHRTALHYAVLSGSLDIVSVLLDSGAQVRFEPEYNRPTPLHLAVRRGDIKMINVLIDVGSDINSSTTLIGSVLHMACSEKVTNRMEVMELLLARGADPNIIVPGLDGSPMLPPLGDYLAASDEHDTNVINLLLRYGAEVIMRSPLTSPLGLLGCVSSLSQQPLILEELLEGAQQFDLELIRHTSLLGSEERKLCLEIAASPLPLRHLSRVCLRHESATARPESVLKMELPSIISKYLLYEIS